MKVELIDFTGIGRADQMWHAADVMIFTKQTRLNLSSGLMSQIKAWGVTKKEEELQYMAKTIKSSWEFVDVTFLLSGISRAVAQQITRTRNASYAMQSMRVTDASGFGVVEGAKLDDRQREAYRTAVDSSKQSYKELVEMGDGMG